jgi:DNA-binding PadR family transcriptional regulator
MAQREHLGSLELLVLLAVLRTGRNASGTPIAREVQQCGNREVSLGSIYSTLARLEAKGLVFSRLGEPTAARGGRAKAYFRLSAFGLREVREARDTLTRLWQGIAELEHQEQ